MQENSVRIKHYRYGVDEPETADLKIGRNLESVAGKSTQLAGLVLTLIKFELIRRDAYPRWRSYLNQVGLKLLDLIAYLNVLYDDEDLVKALKAYYYKSKADGYDKISLLREANALYEDLLGKINHTKSLNGFAVHTIREQILD
ncbi:MAG: hypothetical protein KW802_01105 [Candidatus Doudnabacteria bacterium]|nr:hypothetical protein [Candidatus Doudnabacteria bacterium]